MADLKISEMTPDDTIGGSEKIPVDDAGSPKYVTPTQIKSYTVDQIEAIAAGDSVSATDGIYVLQSGVLKPVDIDLVTQYVQDVVWAKTAETSGDDADKLALLDGSTEKTITLAYLWAYINAKVLLIKTDDLAALEDNTDNDATVAKHGFMSKADKDKLDNIEELANVTDTANVASAGALMASNLLDEDDMSSDSATQPASQQSAKAYVDNNIWDKDIQDIDIDGTTDIGADLQDGDLILVDDGAGGTNRKSAVSRIWTYITGKIQALSAKATPVAGDILTIQDSAASNALKELTMANLATYIGGAIEAAILDVSDLDAAGALTDTDMLLVTQTTTGKKVVLSTFATYIYASLVTHVNALSAVTVTADADVFYVIQSGVEKKVTLAQIAAHLPGGVDGTGTADTLAKWSDTDTLTAGPSIATSFTAIGSDDELPTSKAVRGEMSEIINDCADIDAALEGTDTFLVDDGAGGTQKKSTLSRIWTYIQTTIQALTAKTTAVGADILMIQDSAASNVLKGLSLANLFAYFISAYTQKTLTDDATATIDLGASATYRAFEVKGTIDDGTLFQHFKCVVHHDGTDAYVVNPPEVQGDDFDKIAWNADINSGTVRLKHTVADHGSSPEMMYKISEKVPVTT